MGVEVLGMRLYGRMWKGEPAAENVGMEECVNEGMGMRLWENVERGAYGWE